MLFDQIKQGVGLVCRESLSSWGGIIISYTGTSSWCSPPCCGGFSHIWRCKISISNQISSLRSAANCIPIRWECSSSNRNTGWWNTSIRVDGRELLAAGLLDVTRISATIVKALGIEIVEGGSLVVKSLSILGVGSSSRPLQMYVACKWHSISR